MRKILLSIIILLFILNYTYSQNVIYVKEVNYEGYIFPKESLFGNSPEMNRYTPSQENIRVAEQILREYMMSNKHGHIELPKNRRTLKKFTRQYLGYLSSKNEIIIRINLFDGSKLEEGQFPNVEIIPLLGYCCIQINITTKNISEWEEIR
jgi:hypothetical protein